MGDGNDCIYRPIRSVELGLDLMYKHVGIRLLLQERAEGMANGRNARRTPHSMERTCNNCVGARA